jgi:membrane fusion protein, multidrug efflux system
MKTPYLIHSQSTLSVLLILFLAACHKPEVKDTATPDATHVRISMISREKLSFPVRASGIVASDREIRLSFKTGGIVEALYADDGAGVKKGTLLAVLNVSEIEAQVHQAKDGYAKMLRDYTRAKNLYADSVATLEQLQNAETGLDLAKSSLEIATFNLNHSRIVAPDDGVVLKRLVEAHEVIAPGNPVFLFGTSGHSWKIKAGLSDRDFVRVAPGDLAEVTLDAYPGKQFGAVVSLVSESANPLTGTYEVELNLQKTNLKLASGFVANIEITPEATDNLYRIPLSALVDANGLTGYMFTVTDSMKARKVKVNIVQIYETSAAVSGDFAQTKVVTEGAAYLSDGDLVVVTK